MGGTLDILGVDSDERCRDLYLGWLGADHNVQTVSDAKTALERIDDSHDIVLLGRDLDGMPGRELANEIDDRVGDCHVVLVGSKRADFDIVEYPVDSYVRKPIDGPDLDGVIDRYRTQQRYQFALEEYFRLTSKLGAIEAELTKDELHESEQYRRLHRQVEEKRAEVDDAISESQTDWNFAFKSCTKPSEATVLSQLRS